MEKLKVGDRVVNVNSSTWGTHYNFSEVEKLTPTQAVLKNGVRLVNEPKRFYYNDESYSFSEKGNKWKRWELETPEILADYKLQQENITIKTWFRDHKFTPEEKKTIYELLNPTK